MGVRKGLEDGSVTKKEIQKEVERLEEEVAQLDRGEGLLDWDGSRFRLYARTPINYVQPYYQCEGWIGESLGPVKPGWQRAFNLPGSLSWAVVRQWVQYRTHPDTEVTEAARARLDEVDRLRAEAALYHDMQFPSLPLRLKEGVRLLPYQEAGVAYLVRFGRAILADWLGAGKTAQAVVAADQMGGRVLVVCPKSLVYQWVHEGIERFSIDPDASVLERKGEVPRSRWVVTNYETVTARLGDLVRQDFSVLIGDEAVRVKNPNAKRTRAFVQLSRRVPKLILITGVPIRNRLEELFRLLQIVDPRTFNSWMQFYSLFLQTRVTPWGTEVVGIKPSMEEEFHRLLLPYVLRRERAKLLELPPVTEEVVYVPLETKAKNAYRSMEKRFVAEMVGGDLLVAPTKLSQLVRLRQIAQDPALVGLPGESSKTRWIEEWLEDHGEFHKLFVVTPFAGYARRLYATLARFSPALITGEQSLSEREQAKKRINQDRNCRVLIGVDSVAGEGLNLQEGPDAVVFAGLPWTPDLVDQAVARLHRMGRTRPVHVYKLVAPGTIDEDQLSVLERKEAIAKKALALKRSVQDMVAQEVAKGILTRWRREGGGSE